MKKNTTIIHTSLVTKKKCFVCIIVIAVLYIRWIKNEMESYW